MGERVFEVYFLLKRFQQPLINYWLSISTIGSAGSDNYLREQFSALNANLLAVSRDADIKERIFLYADALQQAFGNSVPKMTLMNQITQYLNQYQGKIDMFDQQLNLQLADPMGYTIVDVPSQLPAHQKFGGYRSAGARDTYNYVATKPFVKSKTTTQPCITERRLIKGPGYWSVLCERTERDGVKRCKLHRIDEVNNRLVYVPCESTEVQVLKGAQVDVNTLPSGVVQQQVQPIVDTYKTMRKLPAKESGVEFEKLPRVRQAPEAPAFIPVPSYGGLASTSTSTKETKQGGGLTNQSGLPQKQQQQQQQPPLVQKQNKKQAGAVVLPDSNKLMQTQFKLNDLDVRDAQARLPDGTIAQPNEWQNLPALSSNEVEYYAYDDGYGTSAISNRKMGFNFPFKFLPLSIEKNKSYLQWLIGVVIKMRINHWRSFDYLYDSNLDTIATLEAAILNGLAKLEARKQFFARRVLFAGAEPYEPLMPEILKVYAFKPPTEVWISPMSARYIDLPDTMGLDKAEKRVQTLLSSLLDDLTDAIQNGSNENRFLDADGTAILFPDFEGGDRDFTNTTAVGMLEAALLSLLSRLQFKLGLIVNLSAFSTNEGSNYESQFMQNANKKFLDKDLKRYIDEFSNAEDSRSFIRLPELRLEQAAKAGIRLPPSTVPSLAAAKIASLPVTSDVIVTQESLPVAVVAP